MRFHSRWTVSALFVVALGVSTLAHAASVSGQGTWETTLQGRDLNGNLSTAEAYYDTALNITWLANANVAGAMNWASATAWAAGLSFTGANDWRLPSTVDADGPDADALPNDGCSYTYQYQGIDCGYNITTHSEMSHMFYVSLGNKAYFSTSGTGQPGWGLSNTGPFSAIRSYWYWSATEYAPNTSSAWAFNFDDGLQFETDKILGGGSGSAWAVHSGDVGVAVSTSTVPVPASVWLFGSGLLGLIGVARRKARA